MPLAGRSAEHDSYASTMWHLHVVPSCGRYGYVCADAGCAPPVGGNCGVVRDTGYER